MTRNEEILEKLEVEFTPRASSVFNVLSLIKSEYYSLSDLEKYIKPDIALSTKILKLANSPIYGLPGQIKSLKTAISYLGENLVLNLLITHSLKRIIPAKFGAFFDFLFFSALASKVFAKFLNKNHELIFTLSLLKDFGFVVLANSYPEEFENFLKELPPPVDMPEIERKIFPVTHQKIGEYFFKKWNFDEIFIKVVNEHHKELKFPLKKDDEIINILQIVKLGDLYAYLYVYYPDYLYFNILPYVKKIFPSSVDLKSVFEELRNSIKSYKDFFLTDSVINIDSTEFFALVEMKYEERFEIYESIIRKLTDIRKTYIRNALLKNFHNTVDDIYHEINNPLAILFQYLQIINVKYKKGILQNKDLEKLFSLYPSIQKKLSSYMNIMMSLSKIKIDSFKYIEVKEIAKTLTKNLIKKHIHVTCEKSMYNSENIVFISLEHISYIIILLVNILEKEILKKQKHINIKVNLSLSYKNLIMKISHDTSFIPSFELKTMLAKINFDDFEIDCNAIRTILKNFYSADLFLETNKNGGKDIIITFPTFEKT